jgi:hypothetical protein
VESSVPLRSRLPTELDDATSNVLIDGARGRPRASRFDPSSEIRTAHAPIALASERVELAHTYRVAKHPRRGGRDSRGFGERHEILGGGMLVLERSASEPSQRVRRVGDRLEGGGPHDAHPWAHV